MTTWCLEVLEFITSEHEWRGSKLKHVGYMNATFNTRADADTYYNRHNPHMRRLNAHNTWISDWDPETRRKYIVRKDYNIEKSVPPFDVDDD